MNLSDVQYMAGLARKAGLILEETDYGWTVGARRPGAEKVLIISEVFRAERDGYIGSRIITEECLREWIAENP